MIPRDLLLLGAVDYCESDALDPARALNQLGGRKLKAPSPAFRNVSLPSPRQLVGIGNALSTSDRTLGELSPRVLSDLVSNAGGRGWVFELIRTDEDTRRVGLVRAVNLPYQESPVVVVGALVMPPDRADWDLSHRCVSLEDVPEALEDLAVQVVPEMRGAFADHMQKVLWLGGSSDEHGGPADWAERLWAAGVARGLQIEIQPQPYRYAGETKNHVNRFSGAMVVLWLPYCGGSDWGASAKSAAGTTIQHIEAMAFPEALVEFLALAEALPDDVGPPGEPTRTAPEPGETRYYKKHYARRGGGDKMVDFHDCGHDKWTGHTYAPQAETGIKKLEGIDRIDRLEKCLRCTGGGVWRVTF